MSNALMILEQQMQPLAPRFAQVLGATMPVERLMRTVMISVERLPQLLDCDRQSIFNAAMSAACLGLEVDGVTGQGYLIPFKGKAQLVIGYKGYNTLGARSGLTITGAVVREGDVFDFDKGEGWVKHKAKLSEPGRRIIAAWAKAAATGRPAVIEVLGIDELLAVKARSPGAARRDSPWNDPAIGFPAMCEKTAKRRLARSLPLNVMQMAARVDEAVDEQGASAWISPDKGVVIEGEIIPPRHTTEQPSTDDLIAPRPTGTTDAADQAAPADMAHPTIPPAGAAEVHVPEWPDYVDHWTAILDEATSATQLGQLWNSSHHKATRRAINWPAIGEFSPDPLEALTKRVTAKIAALKGPA